MQKFAFEADGTIEEFRRRAERLPGIQLNLAEGKLFVALAAALWFAIEHYEQHVANEMKENGNTEIGDFVTLHNITHDFADLLQQMFGVLGMELVEIPTSCHPKNISEILEKVQELREKLSELADKADPPIQAEGNMPDEVSADEETGSVDTADKAE